MDTATVDTHISHLTPSIFIGNLGTYIADSKAAMAAAYATGDHTMQEIATCFRVHYATVSRAVKKHEAALRDCKTCC
ncbi:MAG: hypothetical protein Q7J31_17035 [Syntrophales bacterium]|nr:hypothetical protein [Syntrophales bacterium]